MSNQIFNEERADFFVIEIIEDLHKPLISFLHSLGFEYDELQDFDTIYYNTDFFIFVCKNDLRIYLVNGSNEEEALLIINSHFEKNNLLDKIEPFFKI